MTYCVGMRLEQGLVFLSDSRTNAGVDHINTFRKMTVWEKPGDRLLVLMTSGNLAISQTTVSLLKERMGEAEVANLGSAPNMFEAARLVGEALRDVRRRDAEALSEFGVEFNAALIFGGQIGSEAPRLFLVYAAGNFIEATADTPYFQIGESKYGKPIIDRVLKRCSSLQEAAKLALISMDSTIRSNLSVGLPLDLLTYETDSLRVARHDNIGADDPYFNRIRTQWSECLTHAFDELPNPEWS